MRVRSHLRLTMFSALLESSCSWSIINCVTMLSISPYLHFFLIFVVASGNLLYEIFSLLTFHFLLIGSPPFLPLHFAWFFCCYPTLKLFMTIWLDLANGIMCPLCRSFELCPSNWEIHVAVTSSCWILNWGWLGAEPSVNPRMMWNRSESEVLVLCTEDFALFMNVVQSHPPS